VATISQLVPFLSIDGGDQDCLTCSARHISPFCNLPSAVCFELRSIEERKEYVGGETLFVEGDEPRGMFILCKGRVKICIGTSDGNSTVLRVADPGAVFGLKACISGSAYQVTATAIWPSKAVFISCSKLLSFLNGHPQAWLAVGRQLCQYCDTASRRIRTLALPRSALAKLAHLLMEWSRTTDGEFRRQVLLAPVWTQEEIGRAIGVSRKTVSRLLTQLRRDGVADIRNSVVYVNDPGALKLLAGQ